MHVANSIQCEKLFLSADSKSIQLSTEARIDCQSFQAKGEELFVDGRIFSARDNKELNVDLTVQKLHIGVDGCIGIDNHGSMSNILSGRIKGDVANFGTMIAKNSIDLDINGSILSLAANTDDSAHRGFEAMKKIRRVRLITNHKTSPPTSTALTSAIRTNDVSHVAHLLERCVDPNDIIIDERKETSTTPRRALRQAYRKAFATVTNASNPEEIATIGALFETRSWRRGTIRAREIKIVIRGDLLDCAQLYAEDLDATVHGQAVCEADSIWTSGSVRLKTDRNLEFFGQTKLNSATLAVNEDILTDESAQVAIDKQAVIRARNFECAGGWYVEESMNMLLEESCQFFSNSILASKYLFMIANENCTTAGYWALKNMDITSHEQFQATSTATVALEEHGSLISKTFYNEGKLTSGHNLQITTGIMMQAKTGSIQVVDEFKLIVLMRSDENWFGLVVTDVMLIATVNRLRCSGTIKSNSAEVRLMSRDTSQFVLDGDMSVNEGPLQLIGESDRSADVTREYYFPGFILSHGVLHAQAIVGPNVAIELIDEGVATLTGIDVGNGEEMAQKIILQCGWLHIHADSMISAISDDDITQQFICENTWIHQGTLKQTSTSVCFYANYFLNTGRLTFLTNENHLLKAVFQIGERFVNRATISSVALQIIGSGILENCDQILAQNGLAIKMKDVINQLGTIQAQIIFVEYSTDQLVNLSGKVNATISLLIKAIEPVGFDFLCTSNDKAWFLLPQQQFSIRALKHLTIASEIQYMAISTKAKTTLSTRQQLIIDAVTHFPSCIVNVSELTSTHDNTEQNEEQDLAKNMSFLVTEKGTFSTPLLNIQGQCKQLDITVSGTTTVKDMNIVDTIETILVQGCGPNQTMKQIFYYGKSLELGSLKNLVTHLIDCNSITVLKGSSVELESEEEDMTKVSAMKDISILGDLSMKKSLLLSSKTDIKPSVNIEGTIKATATNSALHIDSDTLCVSGTIHTMDTCDAKCKTNLIISENGHFHTIQTLLVDGEWITWNGKVRQCKKVTITSWGLLCTGEIITDIDELEIQAGLVFSNIGQISGTLSTFAAPFLFNVSLNDNSQAAAMGTDASKGVLDIKSLVCLCTASQMLAASIQNASVLLFKFATLTAAETPSKEQLNEWKNTVDRLSTHFSTESTSYEDVCRSMQSISESNSKTEIQLRDVVELYASTKAIVSEMKTSGIATFNVPVLVDALMKANTHFQNVSSIRERLLQAPRLARELYSKGIRKLKSLHETFGFQGIKATDPTKKGIQETGMWSYHSGTMAAGAGYTAMFIESWYNDGTVSSSAGDIEIGSKSVKQSSAGRLLSAYGSVFVEGESVNISNATAAKELWIQVSSLKRFTISNIGFRQATL